MNICSTHLKLKKMSNICDFDRILKTECNLQYFARNCRINNLDDLKRGRRVFVGNRTFECEGERNDHMLHYKQVFGNVFERRERKCCAVLMKHRHKVKGEQVITLQIAQRLKTNLLQSLTMISLNVKHQGKSSNQLALHLSASKHL